MSSSPIITGLMIFFSVTTFVVVLFPIVKLAPMWFERSVNRKIGFHRDAVIALGEAVVRTRGDAEQLGRLEAQLRYHRAALSRLAPDDAALATPAPAVLDAAA
jgi:hypothetical protein